ncbi:MAG: hypothetical protein IPP40_00170 [bacterium]|nr:hypothetical protein [bacterium]
MAGCAWTPERANPYDPDSPLYIEPPISNRPPQVLGLSIRTNCVNFATEDLCGVNILARIADPDSNLRIDEVVATVNDRFFGRLTYVPTDTLWVLAKQGTELDSGAVRYYNSLIRVSVSDDSGATDSDTTRFPLLFTDYPEVHWPDFIDDIVCDECRDFSWDRWTGQGQAREFEMRFYFLNFDLVPSLTIHDISPQDTFITVDRNFVSSDSNSTIFYGWRLFVIDQNGNSAGSIPGGFNYRENSQQNCIANCGQ